MHLDPEDLARDTPTQAWPRPRLRRHPAAQDPTRLALDSLGDVAAPTAALPLVPAPVPERDTPPPTVTPIPPAARSRAAHPSARRAAAAQAYGDALRLGERGAASEILAAEQAAEHVARVLEADTDPGARIRRVGPGGIFGWRPLGGPTLHEVAEARRRIAETEERRRVGHQRHMDHLETVRAYLGVFALVLLVLLIGAMATLAFGIMAGWWAWGPTR